MPGVAGGREKDATTGGRLTLTVVLGALTLLVLALSLPQALRDAYERGGLYLFSRSFFEDLPLRLTGPGRLRFVLQPILAGALGVRSGRTDAREGRPPYLWALAFGGGSRVDLVCASVARLANLLFMGIVLDAVSQWLILGASYPAAALVVGPALIGVPYAVARSVANRPARRALRLP